MQVVMRNPSHKEVLSDISKLWRFLISFVDPIVDIAPGEWAIFDTTSVPIPMGQDEKGNYLYSLNFPVTTSMYKFTEGGNV